MCRDVSDWDPVPRRDSRKERVEYKDEEFRGRIRSTPRKRIDKGTSFGRGSRGVPPGLQRESHSKDW